MKDVVYSQALAGMEGAEVTIVLVDGDLHSGVLKEVGPYGCTLLMEHPFDEVKCAHATIAYEDMFGVAVTQSKDQSAEHECCGGLCHSDKIGEDDCHSGKIPDDGESCPDCGSSGPARSHAPDPHG